MQRHELIAAMSELGLKGMAAAYDEAVTAGIKRQRDVTEILADLIKAEAADRAMRSIRYRLSAAKLPLAKDLDGFVFDGTPINAELVRSLHAGSFLAEKRNIVLIGGTGSGKTHLCLAIVANVVRGGVRGRFFNVVDLVNRLEAEARAGKAGMLAAQLARLDVVALDELGYLPFAKSSWALPAAASIVVVIAALMFLPPMFRPVAPTSTTTEETAPTSAPTSSLSAGQIFRDCDDVCPEMVVIPAGSFMMGSPDSETGRNSDEGPLHQVSVQSYAASQYEVTRGGGERRSQLADACALERPSSPTPPPRGRRGRPSFRQRRGGPR